MASSPERKRAKSMSADRKNLQQSVDSSSGSVFTPGGQRKSARASARKGRDTEVFMCDDILFDVFAALDHVQLGSKVALVSARYDAVVASHFKYKKLLLRLNLWIRKKEDSKETELVTNFDGKPNGINGFKSISISHIDAKAVEFLEHFRRLFNCDIAFQWDCYGTLGSYNEKAFCQVWSIFSANIAKTMLSRELLLRYRRLIGPTVLNDCANLRMITVLAGLNIKLPANDRPGSAQGQALAKWLYTPRADGLPKVLTMERCMWKRGHEELMEAIKKEFANATSGVNFIVRFPPLGHCEGYNFKPFELVNGQTGERMALRSADPAEFNCRCPRFRENSFAMWLLERGPERRDAQQWINWAQEDFMVADYWTERGNVIYVNLNEQRQLKPRVAHYGGCLGKQI